MKKMKQKFYTLAIALLLTGYTFGQTIDQKRMDRDLEIAENILQTLSNQNHNGIGFSSHFSESSYIPDYGVIFNFNVSSNKRYIVSGRVKKTEMFKDQATAFLVDYADLIGQLKATDKIMISSKNLYFLREWVLDDNSKSTGRTAEIIKSDLIAYKKGTASREATIKKIKFSTTVKDEKVERDLELFGAIFAKLYDSDLSNTYYTSSSRVNYERMDNFGAIYNMRVYSSSSDNGLHTIRTTRESGLTQEERDSKVNAMYPEFERSVKENLLDYGRTIKSLGPNEILMFKIRLTTCEDCEMPRSIEVSVKASVLSDYGSGKTSKENAMKTITVKKSPNN